MGDLALVPEPTSGGLTLRRSASALVERDSGVMVPWLRIPRESVERICVSGGAIYCASRTAIDRYAALEGEVVRTAVLPLESRMACDPAVDGELVAWIDGEGCLVEADFSKYPGSTLSLERVAPNARVRIRSLAGRVPMAIQRTRRGFAVVLASSILELDREGCHLREHRFPGLIAGISFDSERDLGLIRDHDQRLFSFRPCEGISPPSERAASLPRPYTFQRDLIAVGPDGDRNLWFIGGGRRLYRARVLTDGEAPECVAVESLGFGESLLSASLGQGCIAVLLAREQHWSCDALGPIPESPEQEPTGKAASFAIVPVSGGRLLAVSRWQSFGRPLEGRDGLGPPLRGARIAAAPAALWLDTPERACRWDRARSSLEQMPSTLRGEPGATCAAASPELVAFVVESGIVVTNRVYGVSRRIRLTETPSSVAISDGILVWSFDDGRVCLTDANADGAPVLSGKLPRPARAIALQGSILSVLEGRTLSAYRVERRKRSIKLYRERALKLPFEARCSSGPWEGLYAAASRNKIALVGPNGVTGEFLHDETISSLAFDGAGKLTAATPTGFLAFSIEGGLRPIARVALLGASAMIYGYEGGAFDGDLTALGFYKADEAPSSPRLRAAGTERPAEAAEERLERALRRSAIII